MTTPASTKTKKWPSSPAPTKQPAASPQHVLKRWLTTNSSSVETKAADRARGLLFATADAARDLNAVSHWWTATLAAVAADGGVEIEFFGPRVLR